MRGSCGNTILRDQHSGKVVYGSSSSWPSLANLWSFSRDITFHMSVRPFYPASQRQELKRGILIAVRGKTWRNLRGYARQDSNLRPLASEACLRGSGRSQSVNPVKWRCPTSAVETSAKHATSLPWKRKARFTHLNFASRFGASRSCGERLLAAH